MRFQQRENNIYLMLILLFPTNHEFGTSIQHLFHISFFNIYNYLALMIDTAGVSFMT